MIVEAGTVCVKVGADTIVCVAGVVVLDAARLALDTPTIPALPLIGMIWNESGTQKEINSERFNA